HRPRKDFAVGGDDGDVGRDGSELFPDARVAKRLWLEDRNSKFLCGDLHVGGCESTAATGGPVGLGDHGGDVVSGFDQRAERRHGERGRTHEQHADARHRARTLTSAPRDTPRCSATLASFMAMAMNPELSTWQNGWFGGASAKVRT